MVCESANILLRFLGALSKSASGPIGPDALFIMIGKIVKVRPGQIFGKPPALVVGIVEDESREISCVRVRFLGADREHIYDVRDLEVIDDS